MRTVLGALLVALLVLTGCGSESGTPSGGRASQSASGQPTAATPADGPLDHELVAIVSGSVAGPTKVDATVTPLPDDAAVRAFAARFRGGLPGEILDAAEPAGVPGGQALVGAVVAIGCEPPSRVHVRMTGGRLSITADPVLSRRQCFAPVTSVALVTVPSAAAPTD